MGKGVEEQQKCEERKQLDKEIQDSLSASSTESEEGGEALPFFLPRKHSSKNYFSDSDLSLCSNI